MRRPGLAVLVVASMSVLLLGPGAAPSLSADPGAPQSCQWTRHTKRVVHHVRRHGKIRTVVRFRHWWTCEPVPAVDPVTPPPPPAPTPEPDPVGPGRLGVEATEFSYTLSRPHLSAGDVIIELQNSGGDPHNLNIVPEGSSGEPLAGTGDVAPGSQATVRFNIPAGTYRLYCSLPNHEAYGMSAELVVDP